MSLPPQAAGPDEVQPPGPLAAAPESLGVPDEPGEPDEPDEPTAAEAAPLLPVYVAATPPPARRTPQQRQRRRRRVAFWAAVLVALAAVGGGAYLAQDAYATNTAPETIAGDYLAALARADAPAALAYGEIPTGSQELLTTKVLRTQQDIAPMTDITTGAVNVNGDEASVDVHYRLGFADDPQTVDDKVELVRDGRSWKLSTVAVPVSLHLAEASHRGSLAGSAVPTGTRLVFPGAMPIEFDTDALTLTEDTRAVLFTDSGGVAQEVQLSEEGEAEVADAVDKALTACLDGSAPQPTLCPLPADPRAVPGTLRGSTTKSAADVVDLSLEGGTDGLVHIQGEIPVTGDYKQLDFNNLQVAKSGPQTVPFVATCYAAAPDTIFWQSF